MKSSNVHEKDIREELLYTNTIHLSLWKQSTHDKSTFIPVSSDTITALNSTVNELLKNGSCPLLFSMRLESVFVCIWTIVRILFTLINICKRKLHKHNTPFLKLSTIYFLTISICLWTRREREKACFSRLYVTRSSFQN